jgi:hypothetical protein
LWRGGLAGCTAEEIDVAAEDWLARRCNIKADFEIADALSKLERLRLAGRTDGRWRAVTAPEALRTLDEAWDQQFQFRAATTIQKPRIWRPAA